ncbi:MAG: (d)CMP kinase [Hyphomicrobiales bacterium]|nr:(d)CMP kinase [Hyphomicrobiales bacterium]MBV9521109.1 (d)CMP kinase [Hyphomicrobiales bacterium]
MIIAIDGPAASGKGTLAKAVAAHCGLAHLDSGLLYRGVAKGLIDRGLALEDEAAATEIAAQLDLSMLDAAALRGAAMGEAASRIAAHASVRAALVDLQRSFARQPGGAVIDGRDIGTAICPDADVKLFITASSEERARRRWRELVLGGAPLDYDTVLADIRRRDERDSTRSASPLRQASDAVLIDTTRLDAQAALSAALAIIGEKRARREPADLTPRARRGES